MFIWRFNVTQITRSEYTRTWYIIFNKAHLIFPNDHQFQKKFHRSKQSPRYIRRWRQLKRNDKNKLSNTLKARRKQKHLIQTSPNPVAVPQQQTVYFVQPRKEFSHNCIISIIIVAIAVTAVKTDPVTANVLNEAWPTTTKCKQQCQWVRPRRLINQPSLNLPSAA